MSGASTSTNGKGNALILNDSEYGLVVAAFNSFDHVTGNTIRGGAAVTLVPLVELQDRFNASEHPRVKEGSMAPSAARDTLVRQFGRCAADHDGGVTLDEFLTYHDKLVDEAYDEQGVRDVDQFIRKTIMGLWRLGNDLLLPSAIRPCFPITETPRGMYASAPMTLVWPEPDPEHPRKYILKGIRDAVRPIFKRCDVPEEVRGCFAYPSELTGMAVHYVHPQISIQRWLDFVWAYDESKFCGVPGIISARVDLESLPEGVRQFIMEHDHAVNVLHSKFIATSTGSNPTYKRSSDAYGYGVTEECKKLHAWKVRSLAGKQYGQQYHGLQGAFFSKAAGPIVCNAATGINL